ncbi:hypothetical protein [Arthrobacter sp. H16F315]|uniref:hypothetical protein n=1 Tax=Arthrobacter sp. H16F315 TaxID=2955314 RepID=UPI0031594DC5
MSASSAFHDTFGRDAFGNYGRPDAGAPGGGSAPAVQDSPGSRQLNAVRGPRARQAPLKLTRRGRLFFIGVPLMLLAALILTLSGFLNAPAKAAESTAELSPTPTVTVTVQPGSRSGPLPPPWCPAATPATSLPTSSS